MKVYNRDEVKINKNFILNQIHRGKIFIYPTDTIYGLGCDATNENSVKKLREMKNRHDSPLSVIAPSKEWILKNCDVKESNLKWLDKLPGPYTLIFKLKNKNQIAQSVNLGLETVGVRIPNHWVSLLATETGKPIITTSANKTGNDFMTSMDNLDNDIKPNVNFIIYEDVIRGRPSNLVDLSSDKEMIKER